MTKKEESFTLPGCSTWVSDQRGCNRYYRTGYQPEAVRALAADAETKLTPGERIALQNDIWASVRVGREPVGDYLAFAQGLQSDRNRAVLEDVLGRLNYIGQYLVNDSDRDAYRAWLRQYLTPRRKKLGGSRSRAKATSRGLCARACSMLLGYDARDPEALAAGTENCGQGVWPILVG